MLEDAFNGMRKLCYPAMSSNELSEVDLEGVQTHLNIVQWGVLGLFRMTQR